MTTLPNKAVLLTQIAGLLPLALDPAYSTRAAADDLYEVVSFCLAVQAAEDAGGNVTFKDGDENTVTALCFHTQPRYLSKGPYTHALIEFDGKLPLEAHIGIYISSKSIDRMECDISIIHKSEADFFRNNSYRVIRNRGRREGPDSSKVLMAVECKYWRNDLSSLVSYACIGRLENLSAKNIHIVVATRSESAGRKVLERLKDHVWLPEILPAKPASLRRIRGLLAQEFMDYQAESRNNQL